MHGNASEERVVQSRNPRQRGLQGERLRDRHSIATKEESSQATHDCQRSTQQANKKVHGTVGLDNPSLLVGDATGNLARLPTHGEPRMRRGTATNANIDRAGRGTGEGEGELTPCRTLCTDREEEAEPKRLAPEG